MAGAVGTDGRGWLVWSPGASLQAVEFSAADADAPISAALASPPVATSQSVTLALRCFAVPCQVATTLLPAVSRAADARTHKRRVTTLGTAQVTLTRHGRHKVVVHLTAAGRRLVAAHRRSVKVRLTESTTLGGYRQTVSRTVSVRLPPAPDKSRDGRAEFKDASRCSASCRACMPSALASISAPGCWPRPTARSVAKEPGSTSQSRHGPASGLFDPDDRQGRVGLTPVFPVACIASGEAHHARHRRPTSLRHSGASWWSGSRSTGEQLHRTRWPIARRATTALADEVANSVGLSPNGSRWRRESRQRTDPADDCSAANGFAVGPPLAARPRGTRDQTCASRSVTARSGRPITAYGAGADGVSDAKDQRTLRRP